MDTGSAKTVWPMDHKGGKESKADSSFDLRTATGEIVESGCAYLVQGMSEWNTPIGIGGVRAPVHKPFASVGEVTKRGCDFYLSDHTPLGGWLVHRASPAHAEIRNFVKATLQKYAYKGVVPVRKETGIYNIYVKKRPVAENGKARVDLCAGENVSRPGNDLRNPWP